MGITNLSDRQFRDNLHRERESRNLSLARLAERVQAKGIKVYATTIAKIEYGERPAKLDEVIAIADVFGVSIDGLVGRASRQLHRGDKSLAIHALAERTHATAVAAEALETGLREPLAGLDAFTLRKDEAAARAECERAGDALADAAVVTRKAAARLKRIQQRMQREFLRTTAMTAPRTSSGRNHESQPACRRRRPLDQGH
jgi:transcriptional regulator with XRE-family HTH domain